MMQNQKKNRIKTVLELLPRHTPHRWARPGRGGPRPPGAGPGDAAAVRLAVPGTPGHQRVGRLLAAPAAAHAGPP